MVPPKAGYVLEGNGPPVVLIHGSMNSKTQWRALAETLRPHFTVLATDLSGYGQTPFPMDPEAHDLMDEVNLIRRTVSDLLGGHQPVHLVAHSYGGFVALGWASRYPAEVHSLNLFEPMANHLLIEFSETALLDQGRRLIERIDRMVARGDARAGAETFIEYFSGEGLFAMLPGKVQDTLAEYVLKMLVDYRTTIRTSLTMEDYRRIDCPTCLVTGQASTDVSLAVSRILRQQMPSTRWVEIMGNHMAPITDPQTVNPVVMAWLAQVGNTHGHRWAKR